MANMVIPTKKYLTSRFSIQPTVAVEVEDIRDYLIKCLEIGGQDVLIAARHDYIDTNQIQVSGTEIKGNEKARFVCQPQIFVRSSELNGDEVIKLWEEIRAGVGAKKHKR